MLPIKLTISGINSFKNEQVVEFNKLTAGFFGIFGPTGSGKSTILDALTLALYGRTPRAKSTNDFISLGKTSAYVNFIFQVGDKEYLVERTFKRKKEGKQTESSACIYKKVGDSFNVVADGVYECDTKIKSILGLGFEEFSKVIALPQGQFANFLNSTSVERTNLISNLFNLNGFGVNLTDVVKSKEKEASLELAKIKGELDSLEGVTQSNYNQINLDYNEKTIELEAGEKNLNEINKTLSELEGNCVKFNELEKVNKKLIELEAQQPAIAEKEERANKISNALPIFEDVSELDRLNRQVDKIQNDLDALKADFNAKCGEYNILNSEVNLLNKSFDERYESLLLTLSKLKELKEKESEIDEKKTQKVNLENEISSINAQIDNKKEEIEQLLLNQSQLNSELEKSRAYLDEVKVDESISLQVKKGAELASQVEIIETLANDLTSINFKILKKQQELEMAREKSNATEDQLAKVDAKLEEIDEFNGLISSELTKLNELKMERKTIIDSLEKHFSGQSLYHIKNAIEKSEATEKNIRSKINDIEHQINDNLNKKDALEAQIGVLDTKNTINRDNLAKIIFEIDDYLQKIQNLTLGSSIADKMLEVENQIDELSQNKTTKNKELQTIYNERVNLEASVKQKIIELKDKMEAKESLNNKLNEKLSELNLTKDEVFELVANQGFLAPLQAAVDEFKANFALYSNLKNKLEDEVKGIIPDPDKLQKLKAEKSGFEGALRQSQVELGVILAKKQKMEADLSTKEFLINELTNKQKRLDLINELLKLLRGRALAEFVAKIYLETITSRANAIASMLLEGKFTLRFENGEFVVLDNLNGQEERSVGTLSGGETFLISLALSLAISEAISNEANHNFDFFFLDEGFGTLDNELCATVISALYKLQNQNFKIGVISHVDILKERINNKILVTKTESEGSKITLDISM